MPLRFMTPEEAEQFRKEHPIGTTLIFGARPKKPSQPVPEEKKPEMTIEEAFKKFLENPYWANLYESAPERVKLYLKMEFATSLLKKGDKEYKQANAGFNDAKKELTKADWKWLLENDGKSALARWHYKTMMESAKP